MIQKFDQAITANNDPQKEHLLPKLWDWKDILLISLSFLLMFLVGQVAVVIALGEDADPFQLVIGSLIMTALPALLSVFGVNLLRKRHSFVTLGFNTISRHWVNISIALGVIAAVVRSAFIYGLIELFPALNQGADALAELLIFEEAWKMLIVGLLASLVVPVYEEIFFRGFIHNAFRNRFGMWASIVGSALLFGLFHMIPAQIITAFLLGLVLGWVYEKSGSLWTVIIVHVVNNGLAMGAAAILAMIV